MRLGVRHPSPLRKASIGPIRPFPWPWRHFGALGSAVWISCLTQITSSNSRPQRAGPGSSTHQVLSTDYLAPLSVTLCLDVDVDILRQKSQRNNTTFKARIYLAETSDTSQTMLVKLPELYRVSTARACKELAVLQLQAVEAAECLRCSAVQCKQNDCNFRRVV